LRIFVFANFLAFVCQCFIVLFCKGIANTKLIFYTFGKCNFMQRYKKNMICKNGKSLLLTSVFFRYKKKPSETAFLRCRDVKYFLLHYDFTLQIKPGFDFGNIGILAVFHKGHCRHDQNVIATIGNRQFLVA